MIRKWLNGQGLLLASLLLSSQDSPPRKLNMKSNLLFAAFALAFAASCGVGVDSSRCTNNNQCPAGRYCDPTVGLCVDPNHSAPVAKDAGTGPGFNLPGLGGGAGGSGGSSGSANKTGDKCSINAECGANGSCVDTSQLGKVCMNACKKADGRLDASMCAAGSVCNPEMGVCFTTCTLGKACSRPELTCQHFASNNTACWKENPLFNDWVFAGQECTESSQCANGPKQGVCQKAWPGGHCTASCTTNQDCGNGVCVGSKNPQTQVVTDFCVARCNFNGWNCREGYTCQSDGQGSQYGFCVPR